MSTLKLYGETTGYVELKAPTSSAGVQVTIPAEPIATQSYVNTKESAINIEIEGLNAQPAFKTTFVAVNFTPSTTYTKISCFNTTPAVNRGSFSLTSSDITVPEDGLYFVSWNVRLIGDGVVRTNAGISVGVNDAVDESIYAAHTYIRDDSGHDETSSNAGGILSLSSGDTLHLYGRQEGAAGTQTSTADVGSFNVYRIGNAI
jgi:hypothetical protein